MTATDSSFKPGSLLQQGYDETPEGLAELSWGLRFTPSVCMVGAIVGLALREPAIHFVLAFLGIAFFWFPSAHPVDLFYNHVLRPLWNGVKLPPNPLPRRIACASGGTMNLGIGLAFTAGLDPLAFVLGGVLIALQLVVITTHFCLASWMWEKVLRLTGFFVPPMDVAEAKALVAAGARLVDVRSPEEFAAGHIDGAVNIPLEQVVRELGGVRDETLVLYCRSGFRSRIGRRHLLNNGVPEVHDVGGMFRWEAE